MLYFRIEITYYTNNLIIKHTIHILKIFVNFKTFLNILYKVIKVINNFIVYTIVYALN